MRSCTTPPSCRRRASSINTAAWSWPTGQQIELGRSHDGYWKRYDGQLDDFRIYNRVLTAGEIASIRVSDALVDNAALKLRFNFSTSGIGRSVTWPFGTLLSSPVLGPAAVWTPVPGAAGYRVQLKSARAGAPLQTLVATRTAAASGWLKPHTRYWVQVSAADATGLPLGSASVELAQP